MRHLRALVNTIATCPNSFWILSVPLSLLSDTYIIYISIALGRARPLELQTDKRMASLDTYLPQWRNPVTPLLQAARLCSRVSPLSFCYLPLLTLLVSPSLFQILLGMVPYDNKYGISFTRNDRTSFNHAQFEQQVNNAHSIYKGV